MTPPLTRLTFDLIELIHYLQVLDVAADSSSVDGLDSAVLNAVDKLKSEGLLSAVSIGELFNKVAENLNGKTDKSEKEDRQEVNSL